MTSLEIEHVERVGAMLDDQETSYLRESCWVDFKAALAEASLTRLVGADDRSASPT